LLGAPGKSAIGAGSHQAKPGWQLLGMSEKEQTILIQTGCERLAHLRAGLNTHIYQHVTTEYDVIRVSLQKK
jgi:hypothetical protein